MLKIRDGLLGATANTINPQIAYLMIGTNNIGNPNVGYTGVCNSQQTANGVVAIANKIREFCPNTKIVLTDIFPTRIYYGMTRAKIEQANRLVREELKNFSNIEFVSMEDDLTTEDGLPDPNKFVESTETRLHVNNNAYELWAQKLTTYITN